MIKANHKTIKSGYRGTPVAAIVRTKEEREIDEALKKKPKAFVQDLCDFCYKKGFVLRKWLIKRKYGLRFGCKECLQKKLFDGWDESFPHKGKFVHLFRQEE